MHSTKPAIPVVIGPFPDPLHGASTINARLVAAVRAQGLRCESIDLSPGRWAPGLYYHATRLLRVVKGFLRILAAPLFGRHRYVVSVDAGLGLFYNIAHALAARLTGQSILLYHHSTRYVLAESAPMRLLLAVAGRGAPHVFCSAKMATMFRARYGACGSVTIVNNAAWVDPALRRHEGGGEKLRLGFLSNLIAEKGFGRAIETLGAARARGLDAELVMAGAVTDAQGQDALDRAAALFGRDFLYRGTLDDAQKAAFYASLDFFLFPSLYRHETQSLVVPEALAAGTPVIAYDHRFVGEILGDGGLLVPVTDSFAEKAVDWIAGLQNPAVYTGLRRRARDQFESERAQAEGQIDHLIAWASGAI